MRCLSCGHENREGARFCGGCGGSLERVCPSCGALSPPNNQFCDGCGHKLAEAEQSPPFDLSHRQSYTPKHLTEKILGEPHLAQTEAWIQRAVEEHRECGMRWHLARDQSLLAELFERRGDRGAARESLSKAVETFAACGADGWVRRTEERLARL